MRKNVVQKMMKRTIKALLAGCVISGMLLQSCVFAEESPAVTVEQEKPKEQEEPQELEGSERPEEQKELEGSEYPKEPAETLNLMGRTSVTFEGLYEDGSVLGSLTAALEGDAKDLALRASFTNHMADEPDQIDLAEESLLRVADEKLYVNVTLLQKYADLLGLDIDFPDIPFMDWVCLPNLHWDALADVIESMPSEYDWENAFEILGEQMVAEDNDSGVTFTLNTGILQIGASLIEQLQRQYASAIASLDVNAFAGEYARIAQEETAVLDEYDPEVFARVYTYAWNLIRTMYNAGRMESLSENSVKIQLVYYLQQLVNYLRVRQNYNYQAVINWLYAPLEEELLGTKWSNMQSLAQYLGNALSGEAFGISFHAAEDGTFDGTITADETAYITGKMTDDSIRGSIIADEEEVLTFSAVRTRLGVDLTVGFDRTTTALSLREKYDPETEYSVITYELESFNAWRSYTPELLVNGQIAVDNNGCCITVSQIYYDGRTYLFTPVNLDIEYAEDDYSNSVIMTLGRFSTSESGVNLNYPVRLTITNGYTERITEELPTAIDLTELIRQAVRQDVNWLVRCIETAQAKAETESMEAIDEESTESIEEVSTEAAAKAETAIETETERESVTEAATELAAESETEA